MKKLKEKVLEAVKIAQECPDNLQQSCFELLLGHFLSEDSKAASSSPANQEKKQEKQEPKSVNEESLRSQEDLSESDLHIKVRKFLKDHGLTLEHLNQLFYKENNEVLSLIEDYKTTNTSEIQVRITLLQCLQSAIKEGEFRTSVEEARQEAKIRKCYDMNNWGGNYSRNTDLFDFDKYSREVQTITLSKQGKQQLADLIKEL